MKILFIKKIVNTSIKILRFFKILIGVVFFFAVSFLLYEIWSVKIYRIEGVVRHMSEYSFYCGRSTPLSLHCLYINREKFVIWDEGEKKLWGGLNLDGQYVEIYCYDSSPIPCFPFEQPTVIQKLKIDGKTIWEETLYDKSDIYILLLVTIISGILLGIALYYEAKEKREKEK